MGLFGLLYIPVVLVVGFILPIKRWHDLNKSGWMILLSFIPLVNIIPGLILLFAPGTKGPNKYGPDPLAPVTPVLPEIPSPVVK